MAQQYILAAVEMLPYEFLFCPENHQEKLAALSCADYHISCRNVPNVFAHVPQFIILLNNKERALYFIIISSFFKEVNQAGVRAIDNQMLVRTSNR